MKEKYAKHYPLAPLRGIRYWMHTANIRVCGSLI